jgi:hypothetical protein
LSSFGDFTFLNIELSDTESEAAPFTFSIDISVGTGLSVTPDPTPKQIDEIYPTSRSPLHLNTEGDDNTLKLYVN